MRVSYYVRTYYNIHRNEVDVPADLQRQLAASVHGVACHAATHTEFLVEQAKHRRSSIAEDATVQFIRELNAKLRAQAPHYSLRVKNGSYTITNYSDSSSSSGGGGDGTTNDDKDAANTAGPRRAKQKIATVKSESPVYKLRNLLVKCVKGEVKRQKREVVIMDQVNLAFEPGKMYLVL